MPSLMLATLAVCAALGAQTTESSLARSVAAQPRDPRLHNDYGIELQRSGRASDAAAHFRAALELDPRYADAAYNLALSMLNDQRAGEALAVLDKHPAE